MVLVNLFCLLSITAIFGLVETRGFCQLNITFSDMALRPPFVCRFQVKGCTKFGMRVLPVQLVQLVQLGGESS